MFKADPVNEVDAVADEGPGALPWFIIASDWLAQWNNFIYNGTPLPATSVQSARRCACLHGALASCGYVWFACVVQTRQGETAAGVGRLDQDRCPTTSCWTKMGTRSRA